MTQTPAPRVTIIRSQQIFSSSELLVNRDTTTGEICSYSDDF